MQHVWPTDTTRDAAGGIAIEGVALSALAEEHGTPLYVYGERELRDNARAFRRAFTEAWHAAGGRARVTYAAKAGMVGALLQIVREEGLGLDIVSGGELAMGLAAGFAPASITFHGNNKAEGELTEALRAGVGKIVIDNLDEVERIAHIAAHLGTRAAVLLRLNPGVDVHTHHKISTGVVGSKFGLPIDNGQAEEGVRAVLRHPELDLLGYHAHIGSQIFEPGAHVATIDALVAFAARMREIHGVELRHLSPGGGFGIAYLDEQMALDPATWAGIVCDRLHRACVHHDLPLPILTVEPGRAIIGPAGVAVYRVGSVKTIPGVRTYVAVDGGMADNIRPALYDARYTAAIANREAPASREVAVVGRYCESGDMLVESVALPEMRVGDLIALPACGAYCLAMASNYNGSLRPAVILVSAGQARLVRHRETYRDLFRGDPVLLHEP